MCLRTRIYPSLALAAALVFAAVGPAASSAAASDMTVAQLDADQYAVDGSDFYWTRSRGRNRFGCPAKTQVLRRDLLSGPTKVIATFSTKCEVEVGWLEAGGGRVGVERHTELFNGYSKKIFSYNRNGAQKRVLDSGTMRGESILDRPTAACGRSVELVRGSPTGEFAVARFTQTSTARGCGDSRNGMTALYRAISPAGLSRKIYSYSGNFSLLFGNRPLETVELNGDHAAIVKSETRRVHAVDLSTGAITRPLPDSVTLQKQKIPSIGVSVGPVGQVLINAPQPRPQSADPDAYMATDLFPAPSDPANVVRKDRSGPAWFCGDRVVAEYVGGEADEFDPLVELDPRTLDVKGVIARVAPGSDIEGCSSSAVTLSSENNGGRTVLHAVPLGSTSTLRPR